MPQDIVAIQEIIWNIKPDLIIETGIAHGGSLCLTASLLALLELEEMKNNSINQDEIKKEKLLESTLILENIIKKKLKSTF